MDAIIAPSKEFAKDDIGSNARGSIELVNISKRFRKASLKKKSYGTLKSQFVDWLFHSREEFVENYFSALDSLSISVAPGESLGVIGRNGSGKSTLLKLISGIYQPDKGRVEVHGRISALIELGAGFHPDFTGRENVYLGGVMFGLSRREIDERFDDIVAYAELEDFIDNPVRTYSSGMYMRLGFSLAIFTDPDILLIDEVLSVGDAAFVHRCHETISDFRRQGKTLVFVTHDLESVKRWCDEAIWLEKGIVRGRGEPCKIIDSYLLEIEQKEAKELDAENELSAPGSRVSRAEGASGEIEEYVPIDPQQEEDSGRWGSRDVEFVDVRMFDGSGEAKWLFHSDESVTIEVTYRINKEVDDLVFGIGLLRSDGLCVYGTNTKLEDVHIPLPTGDAAFTGVFRFVLDRLSLLEHTYFLDVAAHRSDGYPFDYHHRLHKFSVRNTTSFNGVFDAVHRWELGQ